MKVIYYQENNLSKVFFSSNCIPTYCNGVLHLCVMGSKDCLSIYGDDFVIKKIYDNLLVGVEEQVLSCLLNKLKNKEILQKLYDGKFIE